MSLDLMDVVRIDYIKGYFHRNKNIFILSIILLIIFGSIGFISYKEIDVYDLSDEYEKEIDSIIIEEENYANYSNEDILADALFEDYSINGFIELFLHNFSIDLSCIIGGLFLSIPTLILSFINGAIFGAVLADSPLILILFGILPHGIFEIPSSLFALAGGLMLTSTELKLIKGILSSKHTINEKFTESVPLIKDTIISIGIVFILLFVAAFIETFITPILLYLVI